MSLVKDSLWNEICKEEEEEEEELNSTKFPPLFTK